MPLHLTPTYLYKLLLDPTIDPYMPGKCPENSVFHPKIEEYCPKTSENGAYLLIFRHI